MPIPIIRWSHKNISIVVDLHKNETKPIHFGLLNKGSYPSRLTRANVLIIFRKTGFIERDLLLSDYRNIQSHESPSQGAREGETKQTRWEADPVNNTSMTRAAKRWVTLRNMRLVRPSEYEGSDHHGMRKDRNEEGWGHPSKVDNTLMVEQWALTIHLYVVMIKVTKILR